MTSKCPLALRFAVSSYKLSSTKTRVYNLKLENKRVDGN
jgi:hypothetical protein